MKVVFSRLAQWELEGARYHYELQRAGLGTYFKDEIRLATLRISEYPRAWAIESGEVRKCLLHRFPYKLLYSVESDHIIVIAVAHQHRRPEYWIDRESG